MSDREMTNAKEESLDKTKEEKVICAIINNDSYDTKGRTFILRPGYTLDELKIFLDSIDFKYYAGFGGQELFGYILCEKGVWFDRGEYDGSEWWERHKYPKWKEIVKEFQGENELK